MASTSDPLPTAAQILAKFYAAETAYMTTPTENRDFTSTIAPILSPDFICHQSPDLPWGGDWHGRSGLQSWIETMSSYFSALEVLQPQVYELAGGEGDAVLVWCTLRLRVKRSGEVWERPLVQVVEVDRREGWLRSIRPFYWDVRGLRGALGV